MALTIPFYKYISKAWTHNPSSRTSDAVPEKVDTAVAAKATA